MVVGDDAKFDQPLTVFGEVQEIKLETFNQNPGGERHGGHKH